MLDVVTSGLKQISKRIRIFSQNNFGPRQDFFGLNVGNFFSSGAWILPTTIFTGGLLFREEIGEVVTDLVGDPIGDVLDTLFGMQILTC